MIHGPTTPMRPNRSSAAGKLLSAALFLAIGYWLLGADGIRTAWELIGP